jgi:flagellar export protein FliJ
MKAFNFPLESLRTLRKQREHLAQQCYAHALTARDQARRLQELAEEELRSGRVVLMTELKAGAPAARIVSLRTWCSVLEIRRNERAAAVEEARRHVNEAFQQMTAAVRDRESLDRFYEKSERLWQRAAAAEEQKIFDELAVQRQQPSIFESPLLN